MQSPEPLAVVVGVRVEPQRKAALEVASKRYGRTASQTIRLLIEQHLEEERILDRLLAVS